MKWFRKVCLGLVYLFTVITYTFCDCHFPDYVQTYGDGPSWFISYHNDKTVEVTVKFNQMIVKECKTNRYTECRETVRFCSRDFREGRFLVKEVLRKRSIYNSKYTFRCIKFLRRSKSVVQIMISNLVDNITESLCSETLLRIDQYPMISREHPDEVNDCPIVGGHDFQLYNSVNSGPICDETFLPLRVESDCTSKEGMKFYFRGRNCSDLIGMPPEEDPIKLRCAATWVYMQYTFSIVKWKGTFDFWCMRVEYDGDEIKEVYIFFTGKCQSDTNRKDKFLILKHFRRHFVYSICEDEAMSCKYEKKYCDTNARKNCKLSCSLCQPEHEEHTCFFPRVFQGDWSRLHDTSQSAVVISNSTLTEKTRNLKWQCIESGDAQKLRRHVLKLKFTNGCYPRYKCIETELPALSVMRYRTGSELSWPINSLDQVCEDRYFDYKPHSTESVKIARTSVPWLYFVNSKPSYVSCNLPWYIPQISTVDMYDSNSDMFGNGCLKRSNGNTGQMFNLTYIFKSSSGQWKSFKERPFICLASIKFIGENDLLITKDIREGKVMCWTFVPKSNRYFILVFNARDCGNGTNMQLVHHNSKRTPITLVITKNSTICDSIEDNMKGMTRRSEDDSLSNLTVDSAALFVNVNIYFTILLLVISEHLFFY